VDPTPLTMVSRTMVEVTELEEEAEAPEEA
jgi:hypothetical protein